MTLKILKQHLDSLVRNTKEHVAYLNSLIVLAAAVVAAVVWLANGLLFPRDSERSQSSREPTVAPNPIVKDESAPNPVVQNVIEPNRDYLAERRAKCQRDHIDQLLYFLLTAPFLMAVTPGS
jgi:hypothetical protein